MDDMNDRFDKHYWRFADEYPSIFDDDAALALWHRLVRLAGMAWPSAASLPYGVKRRVLNMLTDAELVFLHPANTFRIRGMDKERQGRSEQARNAANTRWNDARSNAPSNAGSNARGNAQSMPSRLEESRAEQSTLRARDGLAHITPAVQEAGESITGATLLSAGERQLTELDRLVEVHGSEAIVRAFRRVASNGARSWRQLVWDSMKVLEPFAPPESKDDRETREAQERTDRAVAATRRRIAEYQQ